MFARWHLARATSSLFESVCHDVSHGYIEEQPRCSEVRTINVVPVQQEQNGSDCEAFAIAYASSLTFINDLHITFTFFIQCWVNKEFLSPVKIALLCSRPNIV